MPRPDPRIITPKPDAARTLPSGAFDLPERLAAKADPALIAADERQFAAIGATLQARVAELTERLAAARLAPGRKGQAAMERDQEIHRLTARRRTLTRYGLDLCLGHVVSADGSAPIYVGRLGLRDGAGQPLLVDWRTPAAEPFFAATHAHPLGLTRRRRYRWSRGRVVDYWDEVFAPDGTVDGIGGAGRVGDGIESVALDDQSAFIASLASSRSSRMRDVLSTIQADQDSIIRASSDGALVVDGGPGTGKTVVALHRAAYLLYSDPRLRQHHGGVLFVGPHQPYLSYVSDVLPSLGEEGVQICTLRDLVPEGAGAAVESDAEVARLKSSAAMVGAIEPAVGLYEEPPTTGMSVDTEWGDLWVDADDWARAFDAPEAGTPHNEARDQIHDALVELLIEKSDVSEVPVGALRRSLRRHRDLRSVLYRAWPLVDANDLVSDLWSVPAYLRRCAPWLDSDQVRRLQRSVPKAWTVSDLPLLDAARQRLGDPEASRRDRQRAATLADQRATMSAVIDDLLEANTYDDGEGVWTMLRGEDLQEALVDEAAVHTLDPDRLAGPFAHILVDEAQELTDAEWQMLLSRCPARSFTIVGDRAQARHGFTESWVERLERLGFRGIRLAGLGINYRTPREVMAEAEPVIRAVLPDANVPTSIRETGIPVRHDSIRQLPAIVQEWLSTHPDGTACVVGDPDFGALPRVMALTPELAKGLEFDLVVLVNPEAFGPGIEGAVDRYVAMTRATQELVILT
jgi:hypothetical protein